MIYSFRWLSAEDPRSKGNAAVCMKYGRHRLDVAASSVSHPAGRRRFNAPALAAPAGPPRAAARRLPAAAVAAAVAPSSRFRQPQLIPLGWHPSGSCFFLMFLFVCFTCFLLDLTLLYNHAHYCPRQYNLFNFVLSFRFYQSHIIQVYFDDFLNFTSL